MHERVLIIGTGLIGASIGLALKALPPELFSGTVLGHDTNSEELATAFRIGAIDGALSSAEDVLAPDAADIYILCTPVLPILDWMQRLAPVLGPNQLVTDAGSTKLAITNLAAKLFNLTGEGNSDRARFLPGHPMAGKESGGAALADANLFDRASWLFTPLSRATESPLEERWRTLVAGMGAIARDLDPAQHDEVCAWVSHLPQMLATALSALLQDTFPPTPVLTADQSASAFAAALTEHERTASSAVRDSRSEGSIAMDVPDVLKGTGFSPSVQTLSRQGAFAPEVAAPALLTTGAVHSLAGRALREMTRLGSSPYSMWRDVALTNTVPIADALLALEQRLAHIRENLRTPELREEFTAANQFRKEH